MEKFCSQIELCFYTLTPEEHLTRRVSGPDVQGSIMAGADKGDQAMQRIFNKEGVTKVDTVTRKTTPEERKGVVSKNCESGPGILPSLVTIFLSCPVTNPDNFAVRPQSIQVPGQQLSIFDLTALWAWI